jgi:TP901 family phage tail tape measure protein
MKLYEYIMRMKDQASDKLRRLGMNASAADNKLNRLAGTNSRVQRSANGLGVAIRGLAQFLGPAVLVGALTLAIKTTVALGAQFDYQMSRVGALTNATSEQFDVLKNKARQMGETTAFTASQSADAMSFLAMAGLKYDQILQAIEPNLNLAAAAQIDLGRAADISTNVMTQFGLQASDTNRIVDVLTKGTVSFNTNLEELATAMNYMGPTAHAFRIELEETTAMYGLLANSGLKGSLATRALGTSMTRLAKPTAMMQELMNQLNIRFFDSEGKFIGLTNTVALLEQKLGGATDEFRQGALATLFGAEAIQEWNILLGAGSEKLREWTTVMQKAGGTAENIAKRQLDNLQGDFITLRSAIEGTTLQLYDHFEPALRGTTQDTTVFFRTLTESLKRVDFEPLLSPLRETYNLIGELGVIMGLANNEASALQIAINTMSFSLRTGFLPLRILIHGFKTWVEVMSTAIDAIGGIGLMLHGLATRNWEVIKLGFQTSKKAITEGFSNVRDDLSAFLGSEYEGYKKIFTTGASEPDALAALTGSTPGSVTGGTSGGAGSTVNGDVGKGLDNISGGGSKAVNVTINLQSLVGEQKFNVNNVKESVSDMERQVTEALLRVLNSANYAAAQ